MLKKLYRLKIKGMWLFSLGFGELGTPIAVVRDIGIVLTVLDLLFKIKFSIMVDILICLGAFVFFIGVGYLLKVSGMADYQQDLGNSVNPQIRLLGKIAESLNIKE